MTAQEPEGGTMCSSPPRARADPDDFLDVGDEDLPVADLPGAGGGQDPLDHRGDGVGGNGQIDLHLRDELDGIFRAPVDLGVPLLTAEALDLRDGHAGLLERVFHLVELERLDDRLDLFHVGLPPPSPSRETGVGSYGKLMSSWTVKVFSPPVFFSL